MTTMPITVHDQCPPPHLKKQVWFDSVDDLLDGVPLIWVGDNLACGEIAPTITVTCALGKGYLTIEETLRRIDQFDERGARRILSALPYHFEMRATCAA